METGLAAGVVVSRYVPVPHEALEAVDVEFWGAVTDLFRRAHALRWAPFQVTERSLMSRWNMSNRKVWNLLGELTAHGFIAVERGTKREQSRVTVFCPTAEADGEVRQSSRHRTRQKEAGSTEDVDESAAHRAAQPAAPSTRHETEEREEQLPEPPARRKSSKASGEPKGTRKTPDTAWVRTMTDRWVAAWGPSNGTYPFDWMKDRQTFARAALALGVELNQPIPPDVLDHLERAMVAYITAARRDDPRCFPKGTPTVGRFAVNLSDWLIATETTRTAEVPRATIEARMRRELDAGATVTELRERLKVTTKLKPPEVAYALTFLDRLEAR